MTCITDIPLSDFITPEGFDEKFNELHTNSTEWQATTIIVKQKYREKKIDPPNLELEKPDDFIPFLESELRDTQSNIVGFRTQFIKLSETIAIISKALDAQGAVDGASFTLGQIKTFIDQGKIIKGIPITAKKELETLLRAGQLQRLLSCSRTLDEAMEEVYGKAIAGYVLFKFSKERKLYDDVKAKDIYEAAKGRQNANALGQRLLNDQKESRDIQDELRKALFADKAIYQEQCFLLAQLIKLVDLKKEKHIPRLAYTQENIRTKKSKEGAPDSFVPVKANAPIMVDDQPFGFINRMTQVAHSSELFNLPTDKLSSLVPSLKLYKVETNPSTGEDLGFVEIKFDTNPGEASFVDGGKTVTALDLFKRSDKRGVGVGLKGFDFVFHGSDPFAAKKAIQAKMTIFATSFGDLIKERRGDYASITEKFMNKAPNSTYKFADLALKTGKTPEDLRNNTTAVQKDNLDKLNFRLKAVLGWANPNDTLLTLEQKSAINDSFININLTPTTHEFNFDETGGVTFTINYLAYIEDYFNNSSFNIFATANIEANRVGRKLFYEFLNNQSCDGETIKTIKEADTALIQGEKANSLSNLLMKMSDQNKILYYNLTYRQITQFLKTGKTPRGASFTPTVDSAVDTQKLRDSFKTAIEDTGESSEKIISALQVGLTSTSRETNKISFFYISDLIDVIMQNIDESLDKLGKEIKANPKEALNYYKNAGNLGVIGLGATPAKFNSFLKHGGDTKTSIGKEVDRLLKAKEQFKKFRLVLGPMELKDPFNDLEMRFCSIGDIPISLNYFMEFLTEKMLSKEQAYYPLTNFIKDLTNDLIRNFVNNDSCFSFNTKQRVRLNSSVITAFARSDTQRKGADDLTYFIRDNPTTLGIGGVFNVKNAMALGIRPVLQIAGPSRDPVNLMQPDREFNYFIFYAGRSYPVQDMTGNEDTDAKNGIFHYVLGKDEGIVKNISLERTDMQGLKELRFEQEGFDGLTQLREVYNANIDCFLNPHTFPGTYIYINPKGFSPEADINYTQFGIGGYYMITRAEHSIAPGKADTRIVAKWVADSSGNNTDSSVTKPSVAPREDKPKKCYTKSRRSQISKQRLTTQSKAVDEIKKKSGGTGFMYGSMGKI